MYDILVCVCVFIYIRILYLLFITISNTCRTYIPICLSQRLVICLQEVKLHATDAKELGSAQERLTELDRHGGVTSQVPHALTELVQVFLKKHTKNDWFAFAIDNF